MGGVIGKDSCINQTETPKAEKIEPEEMTLPYGVRGFTPKINFQAKFSLDHLKGPSPLNLTPESILAYQEIVDKGIRVILGCSAKFGNGDNHLIEFSTKMTNPVFEFLGPKGKVNSICMMPDKKSLYCATNTGEIYQFTTNTYKCLKNIDTKKSIKKMDLTKNGKFLLIAFDESKTLEITNAQSMKLIRSYYYKDDCDAVHSCLDSKLAFLSIENCNLHIVDIQTGLLLKNFQPMQDHVYDMDFFKDGFHAILGDNSGNVKKLRWTANPSSADDFEIVADYEKPGGFYLYGVRLSKDEKNVFLGSKGGVRVFNFEKNDDISEYYTSTGHNTDSVIGMHLTDDKNT